MHIVIVSDIFGRQQALDNFCSSLAAPTTFTVIDPFQGQYLNFADEEHAYQTFIEHCGHDNYTEIIAKTLTKLSKNCFIIGFSAGAAATWRALANLPEHKQQLCKHFIGFYPSQIRHHLHLSSQVKTHLYFPKDEAHFSVTQVIAALATTPNVSTVQTNYLHGFMNPHSINFSQQAYLTYINKLQKMLSAVNKLSS